MMKILGIIRNRPKFLCLQLSEPWEWCSSFPLSWGFGCLCWARSDTAPGVSLLCENGLWKGSVTMICGQSPWKLLPMFQQQQHYRAFKLKPCARVPVLWACLCRAMDLTYPDPDLLHDHRRQIQVVTSWFMTITDGNKKIMTVVSASSVVSKRWQKYKSAWKFIPCIMEKSCISSNQALQEKEYKGKTHYINSSYINFSHHITHNTLYSYTFRN